MSTFFVNNSIIFYILVSHVYLQCTKIFLLILSVFLLCRNNYHRIVIVNFCTTPGTSIVVSPSSMLIINIASSSFYTATIYSSANHYKPLHCGRFLPQKDNRHYQMAAAIFSFSITDFVFVCRIIRATPVKSKGTLRRFAPLHFPGCARL